MHIFVIDINNPKMTQDLLEDIYKQTYPYRLKIFDNSPLNIDLCRLWNDFYLSTTDPLLCFLNNDTRIPPNFISDTVEVFKKEPKVGCAVHISGNPNNYGGHLNYRVPEGKFCQGWDFTIRREAYTIIPNDIRVFGGDDYLFSNLYIKGWKVAVIFSSPIIHYNAKSRRWYKHNRNDEIKTYLKYGYEPLKHGAKHVTG